MIKADMTKPVELCLEIERETDAALLLTDGTKESQWVPKSQLDCENYKINDLTAGDTEVFWMPEWLATKKGFI